MKLRVLLTTVLMLALANAHAAIFDVSATSDSGRGSLRQAIMDANSTSDDDTITFSVSGTIALASALPQITGNTTIELPGTNELRISGSGLVNVVTFSGGTTNTVSGCTIADGWRRTLSTVLESPTLGV